MILLIDNYDSFTYNLYQYIGIFNSDIKVVRNDKITIEEIKKNRSLASVWGISASVRHWEEPFPMPRHCSMESSR